VGLRRTPAGTVCARLAAARSCGALAWRWRTGRVGGPGAQRPPPAGGAGRALGSGDRRQSPPDQAPGQRRVPSGGRVTKPLSPPADRDTHRERARGAPPDRHPAPTVGAISSGSSPCAVTTRLSRSSCGRPGRDLGLRRCGRRWPCIKVAGRDGGVSPLRARHAPPRGTRFQRAGKALRAPAGRWSRVIVGLGQPADACGECWNSAPSAGAYPGWKRVIAGM
jgi:hypothetical protein